MTAHDGSYRVVIVDPAEDMNTNAANALLKNLEEPPPRTLFVLISHMAGRLLPTIRSRCQTIKLKPLRPDDLVRVLEGVGAPPPEGGAERQALIGRAGGSPREAIMLTAFGGLEIADAVAGVLRAAAFPVGKAWRVAEAVGGRDNALQFALFNQTALDMIAAAANAAAGSGDAGVADSHSRLWAAANATLAETETYNLDRKQHVMALLKRMHEAFGG
jgi:DNA polymerase-3 subunit delta'